MRVARLKPLPDAAALCWWCGPACRGCCGIYLLMVVLRRPLEADQVTMLAAGVILVLASMLLYYLVSGRHDVLAKRESSHTDIHPSMDTPLTSCSEMVRARKKAEITLDEDDDLPGPM